MIRLRHQQPSLWETFFAQEVEELWEHRLLTTIYYVSLKPRHRRLAGRMEAVLSGSVRIRIGSKNHRCEPTENTAASSTATNTTPGAGTKVDNLGVANAMASVDRFTTSGSKIHRTSLTF
jgi:hypothetical protein